MSAQFRHVSQAGSLAVTGARGAVSWADHGTIVYHSRQDRGGWQGNASCWLMFGGCWSDPGVTADKDRLVAAQVVGGDDAAYAVLEDLYRQEFES